MTTVVKRLQVFGVALLLLLGTSCVRSITAFFVNPCSTSLNVTTYDHNIPSPQSEVKTFRLESESVTEVKDAFKTVVGFDWTVTVEGAQTLVHVDGDTWVHDTVVIPEKVCEEL